jgi:hypothetical protein
MNEPVQWPITPADWLDRANSFAFDIGPDRFTIERRSPTTWAVCKDGFCLNPKEYVFEWERMSSSRTDEFIATTRFTNLNDAVEALKGYLARWERLGGGWRRKREGNLQAPVT